MEQFRLLGKKEFWRYVGVGFFLFLIDITVVNFLMHFFNTYHGIFLILINVIGVVTYSIPGYFLNKKYAFKRSGNYNYYLTSLVIFAIADSLLFPALASLPIETHHYLIHANSAKIISFIITGIGCYLLIRHWAFKEQKEYN